MLYAEPGGLEAFRAAVLACRFERAFTVMRSLPTGTSRGVEPFGFVDGISEPKIDWEQGFTTELHRRLDYANLLAPGELVLGYPNEYQEVTPRPLVDPHAPGADDLPGAHDAPGPPRSRHATAPISCCASCTRTCAASGSSSTRPPATMPQAREALAAAMVGRQRDGTALIADEREIPGGRRGNDFTYDDDVDGQVCPVGAHIRRANPRTGDHPPGVDGLLVLAPQHARLPRGAGTGSRAGTISSPRPASTGWCGAVASMAACCRPRTPCSRGRTRSAACTSSASAPISCGSSSSCRTPGWRPAGSTGCAARRTRCSATASRSRAASPPTASACRGRRA